MSEDILNRERVTNHHMESQFTPEIYDETLILIEDICLTNVGKRLGQLGIADPIRSTHIHDRDLSREMEFDVGNLQQYVETHSPLLLPEQL